MSRFVTGCILGAAVAMTAPAAMASDPYTDAKKIVEITMTDQEFASQFDVMRPILRPAIDAVLSRFNVSLTDGEADALFELYMEAFGTIFAEQMRLGATLVYMHEFDEEQLAEIRAFLETPTGRAFANRRARLNEIDAELEERVTQSIDKDVGKLFKDLLRAGALKGKLSDENTQKVLGLPL